MINLSDGGFADIWESKLSPETQAISYALQMAVGRAMAAAEATKCFSDIDRLPESALDYFAVEMRTMYYDQSLPIDKKRAIIKNTLNWYTKGGTPSAVKELLSVVFGKGDLEEWFNYGGEPYHFAAVIPVSEGEAVGNMSLFRELIDKIKNVRSHCDELILQEETILKLKTTEGSYRVCPPLCGTIPNVSTAFDQMETRVTLQSADVSGTADMVQASEAGQTGTEPGTSTAFAASDATVTFEGAGSDGTSTVPMSGELKANE